MKDNKIKIEATGNFNFSFYIEKAIPAGTDEQMTIKGVASTVNTDHDNERMSAESLVAMAEIINEQGVPLRVEHQKEDSAIVGNVNKAWVDERNQLWIEADLDKSHAGASMLYKALKSGAKLGLSVGGRVKHAVKEFSEAAGKMVKTFYNVVLDEVSVTSRPANYDAWLVSKSITDKEDDGDRFVDSPIYKEFLFENQCLDYMQSFAKSIPNESWKKVEIIKNNKDKDMTKGEKEVEDKKDEKEEAKKAFPPEGKEDKKDDKKEEKSEDKKDEEKDEEKSFKSIMKKGMEQISALMSKMNKGEGKDEEEVKEKEDTDIMPDNKKDDKKEKSEDKKEDDKKEEKSEDKKDEEDSEYNLKSMKSMLKSIEALSKAMDDKKDQKKEDEKEEKSAEDDEDKKDEPAAKSQNLDKFVATLEKSISDLQDKFEKGGKRHIGLTQMLVEAIRNDADVQKEIRGMMNEVGFKKSMQFGVPMMRTKDGKAYRITATDMDEVHKSKSDNAGKTFKDVYNQNFSSSVKKEE